MILSARKFRHKCIRVNFCLFLYIAKKNRPVLAEEVIQ